MPTTKALENFLREEVTKSYDEYKANPGKVISRARVSAELDARHRALQAYLRKRRLSHIRGKPQ